MVFPDKFIDHAKPEVMYKSANMDAMSIVKRAIKLYK
jgi:deoxyxylulose-5-phosphate synthase